MSAPKPEPSAWEWWCYRCGEIRCTSENRPDWEHVRDLGEHGCGTSGAPYGRAIWGHEWAAVAWMAAAVEIVIEQSGYQPGSLGDPKGEIDELAGLPPF